MAIKTLFNSKPIKNSTCMQCIKGCLQKVKSFVLNKRIKVILIQYFFKNILNVYDIIHKESLWPTRHTVLRDVVQNRVSEDGMMQDMLVFRKQYVV